MTTYLQEIQLPLGQGVSTTTATTARHSRSTTLENLKRDLTYLENLRHFENLKGGLENLKRGLENLKRCQERGSKRVSESKSSLRES